MKRLLGTSLFVAFTLFSHPASFASEKSASLISAEKLMQAHDYKSAIKTLTKAQKAGEDSVALNSLLTQAYSSRIDEVGMLKKMSIAKKLKTTLEHTLELDPKNVDAMDGLVQFHMQAPSAIGGDKKEADRLVDVMATLDPIRANSLRARIFAENGDIHKAEAEFDKVIAASPDNIDAYLSKGTMLADHDRADDAIAVFEACIAANPGNMECTYQIGKAAQTGKTQYEKGIAAFESFIAHGTDDKNFLAYAHYRLGNIYNQMGKPQIAKTHYTHAVEIDDLKPAKKALKKLEE